MAFSELQRAVANLRLTLAGIQVREEQLDAQIAQFRAQLRRLPRQVIYGAAALDSSLAAMGEIDERLADALANRRRVLAIKRAATQEMEALQLVQQLDEARRSLQDLKRRTPGSEQDPQQDQETAAEVRRLEQFIAQNSKRAELAITADYQERQEGQPGPPG